MSRSESPPATMSTNDPSLVADVVREHVTRVLHDTDPATIDVDELRSTGQLDYPAVCRLQ